MGKCSMCQGKRKIDCPLEYGPNDHPTDCPACYGENWVSCPDCDGTGKDDEGDDDEEEEENYGTDGYPF
jgi:hypothetical protein